jgi:carboxylate-amine ligase
MRCSDACTRYLDAIAIASLYQALLAMLYERRKQNQRWRIYSRMLIAENNWRAQRYGVDESLIDFGRGELVPVASLIDELIDLVSPHAEGLGSASQLERLRIIARNGTSSDRQLAVYNAACEGGADPEDAMRAVVDHLIGETMEDL